MTVRLQLRTAWRTTLMLACVANISGAQNLSAGTRFGSWGANTSATFPVVRVDTCSNRFTENFPQPWVNIRNNITAAMNQWFVEGGVDLRLRLYADLAASDARCNSDNPTAQDGELLVTAVASNGGGGWSGLATWSIDSSGGTQKIRSAVVKLAANFTWATNADYPQVNQIDFFTVFLHEFGHAIGLNHTDDPTAVMNTNRPKYLGDIQTRHLSQNELLSLRSVYPSVPAYAPITTTPMHFVASGNGAVWTQQVEPFALPQIGPPAVAFGANAAFPFVVASTASGTGNVQTYISTGSGATSTACPGFPQPLTICPGYSTTQTMPSFHGAAVAVGGGYYLAAAAGVESWSNTSSGQTIGYTRSADGITWSAVQKTTFSSYGEPAIAYVPFKQWFILAWADRDTGFVRTALSKDLGQSWVNQQVFDLLRTDAPFGIACDAVSTCRIAYADANVSASLMTTAAFQFDGSNNLFVSSSAAPLVAAGANFPSYGGSVAYNGSRWQFAWRDRGTATVLTTAGGTAPPVVDTVNFTGFVSHSPPRIVWNSAAATWWMWSSFASRYDN